MMGFRLLGVVALLAAGTACHGEHGHSHDHGGAHAAPEEEEVEPLAITRWTERYELFVELPPPAPGKPVPYHAHVTRLSDFAAVTEGTFRVRFKSPGGAVTEGSQTGVKRPGIFVFESPAPAAGVYAFEMSYEKEGQTDVFDCGSFTVADKPPAAPEEAAGATITFLKESQWKIPFGTAWASERPMARELEIAATIEPAGADQLTLGAPTGGRFFHNPKLALAEGLRIAKGDVLGTIAPTVAGDDFSRLQLAVEESKLAEDRIRREIARIEPLVKEALLPERRLVELKNELQTHSAQLKSASGRLGQVLAPGGATGIPIRSTLAGIVSQVLIPNGEPVAAGTALVRIGGTDHLWIRSRFVAKPAAALVGARPTGLRLAGGETLSLEPLGARFLSPLPVVDPVSRIATWLVDLAAPVSATPSASPGDAGALSGLQVGANVVLSVRVGEPRTLLAVPREAVVEINTRPYIFTQADGEHFEKRAVTLGHTDGAWVHVVSGVKKGDRIVTRGGFDVHLAALMGTVESHRH